jgi:hypothetical protein
MKHHHHQFGTESGIASREAAEQIRMLITDLSCTVQILDAEIAAEEERPRGQDPADADYSVLTRMLGTRRRNLMITIASLEDRLESIEHIRSRGRPTNGDWSPTTLPSHSSHGLK